MLKTLWIAALVFALAQLGKWAAVEHLIALYREATEFLKSRFSEVVAAGRAERSYRAFYPELRIVTHSFAQVDTRLSFGHVSEPGSYATTITRPDLFAGYLTEQISLLIANHEVAVIVGQSRTPMPVQSATLRVRRRPVSPVSNPSGRRPSSSLPRRSRLPSMRSLPSAVRR